MLDKRLVSYWAHMLDECFVNESEKSSATRMSLNIQDYWWDNKTKIAPVICFGPVEDMDGLQHDVPTRKELRAIAGTNVARNDPDFFDGLVVAYAYCTRIDDDEQHAWVWQPWTTLEGEVKFKLCNMMMWDKHTTDEPVDPDAEKKHVLEQFQREQIDILDDEAVEQFI